MTQEVKKEYKLIEGKYYDTLGQAVPVGTIVELNDAQALAFKGMFVPALAEAEAEDEVDNVVTPVVAPSKPVEPAKPTEPAKPVKS